MLRELHFHTLCSEFITEQAIPILHSTRSAVAIRTLLTAKVDELYFNWYTIYQDCRRRVTCTHVLEFCLGPR